MVDKYQNFSQSSVGQFFVKKLGLPNPIKLKRYDVNKVLVDGPILLGAASGSYLTDNIASILSELDSEIYTYKDFSNSQLKDSKTIDFDDNKIKFKAVVFDASGIKESSQLEELYNFFHPIVRKIAQFGRVVILGTLPKDTESLYQAAAQRSIVGFVKSIAKEFKKAITAQLIYVGKDAQDNIESSLRFFISDKSAYVTGQVVKVSKAQVIKEKEYRPLAGTLTLVTGASRGIGKEIAKILTRDGATVICLDVPQLEKDLEAVAEAVGGYALSIDITEGNVGDKIKEFLTSINAKGLDSIVHNAGITRDKTLAKMKPELWDSVIKINLSAIEKINQYLLANNLINNNGRVVCVSSISGIAGNLGQTNYATSKAGIIGVVKSTSVKLENGITINAVAPGFIETQMTAAMPFLIREVGRRMNSLSQGGLPIDVAEVISWLASPASTGLNGNIVRVCGQSLIGA